jgi:hypothetical protein
MADTKISALPNAAALAGTEQIAGVQSGGNVNITPNQLRTFIGISGTYTPALTNVANAGSLTSDGAQYMRVGNTVTVSGRFQLLPTAGATLTRIRLTIPVASDFTDSNNVECMGSANTSSASGHTPGIIQSNNANNEAEVLFYSNTTGSTVVIFHFTYRVV